MEPDPEEVCYCFVDTNVFLHYQHFTEINWTKELGADRVVLVICPVVLHELDKQKSAASNERIRERARKAVSELAEIQRGNKQIRANVDLLFIIREPDIDWKSEGLNPDVPDDRIVATILCERGNMSHLGLVSSDFGLQLKAESKAIRVHQLPDSLMLKPSKSPKEEELARLQKEVVRLKSRIPKLSIKLASEEGLGDFMRHRMRGYQPITDEDIRVRLNEASKGYAGHYNPFWDESDIRRYEADLGKYVTQLKRYLEEKRRHDELHSRSIEIRFVLVNDGTAPAEDINVSLNFRDGFELCDVDHFLKEPTPPEKPTRPRATWEIQRSPTLTKSSNGSSAIGSEPQPLVNTHIKPSIRRNNGCEVTFSCPKLQQHIQIEFDPVYIIFRSIKFAKSFHIDYSIIVDNVPDKISGRINIVLEKSSTTGGNETHEVLER